MTSPADWDEAGKWTSAAQAFFLLAFFFAIVIFGASFRLPPQIAQPAATLETIAFAPIPPEAIKTPEPKPVPKPEPPRVESPPDESPADIALKKREEEERKRKEEEEKKRLAEQKKREEERARKERERKAAEEKRLAEQKRLEEERERKEEVERIAEQKRLAEEERERKAEAERIAAAEKARLAAEAAAAREAALSSLRDSYIGRIVGSIQPHLITPPEAKGEENLEVILEVRLDENGALEMQLEAQLEKNRDLLNFLLPVVESSGVPEYDEAAQRAVLKALPLPMPKEPELMEKFRTLRLYITPE